MRVTVVRVPSPNRDEPIDVSDGATVADVLARVSVHPDAVVVFDGDQPVPTDAPVTEGVRLRIVRVYSGG